MHTVTGFFNINIFMSVNYVATFSMNFTLKMKFSNRVKSAITVVQHAMADLAQVKTTLSTSHSQGQWSTLANTEG